MAILRWSEKYCWYVYDDICNKLACWHRDIETLVYMEYGAAVYLIEEIEKDKQLQELKDWYLCQVEDKEIVKQIPEKDWKKLLEAIEYFVKNILEDRNV